MFRPRLAHIALAAALLGAAPAALCFQSPPQPQAAPAPSRSPALRALLDEHVDWLMRETPEWASTRGDLRFNDKLTDYSPAATARRLAEQKDLLRRLRALDRAAFTEDDQLDADLLDYQLALTIDAAPLHAEQMPITKMDGPHISYPQLCDQLPFETTKHYEDYTARLEALPIAIDQQIEQLRLGLAAGRTPPRVVFASTLEAIGVQAGDRYSKTPSESPFYRPFVRRAVDDALAARARKAIAEGITPAFARLEAFMRDYIPKCRESTGYAQGVDGPAAYDLELRRHTTTRLTAPEIHALGLSEVSRIRAEMLRVIRDELKFVGPANQGATLPDDELFLAFVRHLRADPSFYFTDPEEMLRRYRDLAKRVDPELPRLFGRLPRNTYGIREIPRFASKTSPSAYYYPGSMRAGIPGYFVVNTGNLTQRPTFAMISLMLHEAVPGHHLQGSISVELRDDHPELHEVRSLAGFTAFVEGWALYAEKLGLEMGERPIPKGTDLLAPHPPTTRPGARGSPSGLPEGVPESSRAGEVFRGLYADPYDYFGSLSDEIWRACRLVVDTGIHSMGWTRQHAIDYLLANSAITEYDAASEVDRYIGWPGQACAYKIGQLAIIDLRRLAAKELGDRFDERAFHDCLLGAGALPLPVLEKRVARWIEVQRTAR